jgi:hypothetical protein
MEELKKFDKAKAEIALHVERIKEIKVEDESSLGTAKLTVKAAQEAEKLIETKREELKAPHLEAGRAIDNYAKELKLPLQAAISEGKQAILVFEQEKERQRLVELKKLEDERREKVEAERKETARLEALKNKLIQFENRSASAILGTKTIEELASVENSLRMYSVSENTFQEFSIEALEIKTKMLSKVDEHKLYLTEKIAQEKESSRLQGIAKEQKELELKQKEEARKLQAEKDGIEQEKKELARQKAEEEAAFQRKIQAEKEELERQEKERQLEAEKSKNLRKDWDFEIVNPTLVPREFLTVDETMIRNAVKKGIREISGVRIFQNEKVVLR